jgi:hypothetical protein
MEQNGLLLIVDDPAQCVHCSFKSNDLKEKRQECSYLFIISDG